MGDELSKEILCDSLIPRPWLKPEHALQLGCSFIHLSYLHQQRRSVDSAADVVRKQFQCLIQLSQCFYFFPMRNEDEGGSIGEMDGQKFLVR